MTAPKLFISYSWSNTTREQWVVDLASELRESGDSLLAQSCVSSLSEIVLQENARTARGNGILPSKP